MKSGEYPKVVKDGEGQITTHPAYGQIQANRVSGQANLYGSDFSHNGYVTITLRMSEHHRTLNNDWYFGRQELMSVMLSEAQWATFVSSMNIGSGVPCTIDHILQEDYPALPEPEKLVDTFKQEVRAQTAMQVQKMLGLVADIENETSIKARRAKLFSLKHALQNLGPDLAYTAEQFDRHVEEKVEEAKIEVNAYMLHVQSHRQPITGGILGYNPTPEQLSPPEDEDANRPGD